MLNRSLTALLVLCSMPSCVRPQPAPASPPVTNPPQQTELRALLVAHSSHRFDGAAQQRGCPAEQSLGEYVATLVRNTSNPEDAADDRSRFALACEAAQSWPATPMDPPASPAYWPCRIDAFSSDSAGESPWRYELRFRVRRSDRTLDLETFACPGGA
jgi:hypothetical protein